MAAVHVVKYRLWRLAYVEHSFRGVVWRNWRWRWERAPPVPGDVRLDTCRKCSRGIWASQVRRWRGAARFCYPRSGRCQECQGYGPVS